jgi:hypothetical protein
MARLAGKKPAKRRIKPYAQGDLDTTCGLYAIVNAACALCPEMTSETSSRLFRFLIRSLHKHASEVLSTFVAGMDKKLLRKLLTEAEIYLGKRLKVFLVIRSKKSVASAKSLDEPWRRLSEIVDENTVAIIQLGGRCDHWTVIFEMKPRTMLLLDSNRGRMLCISSCALRPTSKLYLLELSVIFAISRAQ